MSVHRASSAPASPERGNSKALYLTAPRPKGINVETFRIDYVIRTPKVEKLRLQPIGYLNPNTSMMRTSKCVHGIYSLDCDSFLGLPL